MCANNINRVRETMTIKGSGCAAFGGFYSPKSPKMKQNRRFFHKIFAYVKYLLYLCSVKQECLTERINMLGVKSTRKPITGKYAEDLRATLERMRTGNLNEEDLKRREFQTQPSAHTMIWN